MYSFKVEHLALEFQKSTSSMAKHKQTLATKPETIWYKERTNSHKRLYRESASTYTNFIHIIFLKFDLLDIPYFRAHLFSHNSPSTV